MSFIPIQFNRVIDDRAKICLLFPVNPFFFLQTSVNCAQRILLSNIFSPFLSPSVLHYYLVSQSSIIMELLYKLHVAAAPTKLPMRETQKLLCFSKTIRSKNGRQKLSFGSILFLPLNYFRHIHHIFPPRTLTTTYKQSLE